jgi:L-glyceraldehyde 3-phosphate reductase
MGLAYVDIFYSHRPDPDTPLEETMGALDFAVRSGRALYAGISSYSAEATRRAAAILEDFGTPCLIHQPRYSMFDRWVEDGLLDVLSELGIGCIAFSPLAQGLLTTKYVRDIPAGSRAAKPHGFLKKEEITAARRAQIATLNEVAKARGQTLAQLAIAWVLREPAMTSALVGASSVAQVEENVAALDGPPLTDDELQRIDAVLAEPAGVA